MSVLSVKYYEPDASTLTPMSAALYNVVTAMEPGRIQIPDSLPAVDDRIDAIQITFVAGNSTPPAMIKHCTKMLVAHLYENRLPVAFASCSEIPMTLRDMLTNQKIGGFF